MRYKGRIFSWKSTVALVALFSQLAFAIGYSQAPGTSKSKGAQKLLGVWKAQREFPPEASGSLVVQRKGSVWKARIAGYTAAVTFTDGVLSLELPGSKGEFRARISDEADTVTGHWVQPPVVSMNVKFATPVKLTRDSLGRWLGIVEPMRDYVTFFLKIRTDSSGRISALLRNPQFNVGRFFNITNVTIKGDDIEFLEEGREGTRLPGKYYEGQEMFSIMIPDAGGTYDFWRVDESLSDFYPRSKSNPEYIYSQPVESNDGWEVASLKDVGMDTEPIEELVRHIASAGIDSINSQYIQALLISRKGKLVVEEYFHGYNGQEPHDTRSASKSITTTLVGAAINSGYPLDGSTNISEVFYTPKERKLLDSRMKKMTLEHLMTMTSGFACYDGDRDSPGNEDVMQSQSEQADWARFTLDLPMEHEPGEHAAYCSGGMNLVGAVVSKVTGLWLPDFFQRRYAEPLQLGLYHMNLTPSGEGYGGGGLRLTGRDFLKLGYLYSNDGMWNGRRVLSSDWVRNALSKHSHMWNEDYGYGFWLIDYQYKGRKVKAFYAGGNGGQYVIGVPELDLLVTFLAANYGQKVMHVTKREYVPQYILRAIR